MKKSPSVANLNELKVDGAREIFFNTQINKASSKPWYISACLSSKVAPADIEPGRKTSLSKKEGVIAVAVSICLAWTLWLILLNVAPNRTVNRVMDTETFDYGSFWLFEEAPPALIVLAPIGLFTIAACYVAVFVKTLFWRRESANRSRQANILKRVKGSLHEAAASIARTASRHRASSATLELVVCLGQADSLTSKYLRLGMKLSDLALETLMLYQMLEAGTPVALIAIFTVIVASNALACAAMMFVPSERAPLAETFVDILFDFLVVFGFQALEVAYCLSAFTFDRAKLAINLQVFPPGWFEQDASVLADPVETAVIYQTLKTLRIMSVLSLFTRIGVNASVCYRFWQVLDVIRNPSKSRSSVYPKRNRFAAAALILFATFFVVFVEKSLRTSTSACKSHPECAVKAHRWTILKGNSLEQCPCLILIDRDIAPKTYTEWLVPKNVTDKVAQLAATGDLQTLQLTNRLLPELPEELHRCTNLRHLALVYTHTQTFPPWAKDFTKLDFLHVESKFSSPMVFMPDDLFEGMSALTYIHFGAFLPMTRLPSFDGLKNLKSLTLAGFLLLEELPSFDSLRRLERVVLMALPGITTLPDLASPENLQSFTASDRGAWCCNGFFGDCDLSDDKCGVHPTWGTPAATCLTSDIRATDATVKTLQKFSFSICGPVLGPGTVQSSPTEETMAVCNGSMYRQCNKPNEPEAMCYNARFMGIACMSSPYAIKMRRRQIAQSAGDPCDPDVEAWLGCKTAQTL